MSSAVGHCVAAVWIGSRDQQPWRARRLLWLLWLCLLAVVPDCDYLIPAIRSAEHAGLRISHSLAFSLILPALTISVMALTGWGKERRWLYALQALAAGASHILLDYLVGVTKLPILWPLSDLTFYSPVGPLPSAGIPGSARFAVNLAIELGILLPACILLHLLHRKQLGRNRLLVAGLLILFALATAAGWSLER